MLNNTEKGTRIGTACNDPHAAAGVIPLATMVTVSRSTASGGHFHPLVALRQDQTRQSNAHMLGLQDSFMFFYTSSATLEMQTQENSMFFFGQWCLLSGTMNVKHMRKRRKTQNSSNLRASGEERKVRKGGQGRETLLKRCGRGSAFLWHSEEACPSLSHSISCINSPPVR